MWCRSRFNIESPPRSGCRSHNLEGPTVLHYAAGQEITNHFDFLNTEMPNYEDELSRRGQRVITFLIYLNDDYGGGETEFPELGVRHKAVVAKACSS